MSESEHPIDFVKPDAGPSQHWRGVVLFGRNVMSYKFALAKSLVDLARQGRDAVSLEELAVPFSAHICEHLKTADVQGTARSSRFIDACRYHLRGEIGTDELITATTLLGFENVIDAFHVVGKEAVPTKFYIDERTTSLRGIRLTDATFKLAESEDAISLVEETEARWRLVENAWAQRAAGEPIRVLYDAPHEVLVAGLLGKRRRIAEIRPALNGYQKGHCFYCFAPIRILPDQLGDTDVDHFLPHHLMARGLPVDLDQVWNLVLACVTCNRGAGGKFGVVPARAYLERLHHRNEYLITSHHPLRDTLMTFTGTTASDRQRFLAGIYDNAADILHAPTGWRAREERPSLF